MTGVEAEVAARAAFGMVTAVATVVVTALVTPWRR